MSDHLAQKEITVQPISMSTDSGQITCETLVSVVDILCESLLQWTMSQAGLRQKRTFVV